MNYSDLKQILLSDKPSEIIKANEEEIFKMIPELYLCKGFNQNSPWHVYDVYEHILHVIDEVPKNETLRLAALFHDIGKPFTYTEDENHIGHFRGHWVKSYEIFLEFSKKYQLDKKLIKSTSNLIYFHDFNLDTSKDVIKRVVKNIGKSNIHSLYLLKKADLLAQSSEYHYLLKELGQQEEKIKRLVKKWL